MPEFFPLQREQGLGLGWSCLGGGEGPAENASSL